MSTTPTDAYPATLGVSYQEDGRNRLTTFFRPIVAIPIAIVYAALVNSTNVIVLPTLAMILFRQKYPRWWFDFNLELTRFETRLWIYLGLLVDEYPSTDESQRLELDLVYPDAEADLNRWLPLVKWLLLLPHYIVLAFLIVAALVVTLIAWFAILFTGRYPQGLFDFVVGVHRWGLRVAAYGWLLTTDRYPPFSLQ